MRTDLSAARLRELLHYDPHTGLFTRIVPRGRHRSGVAAGYLSPSGYVIIGVDGVLYRAHRLAWLYMFGKWPVHEIDHLNQIKTDNRIENLRDVERAHNEANKSAASSVSISGVRGVSPRPDGAFVARIARRRKLIHLGAFHNISDAEAAYLKAKAELGIGPIPAHVGCPKGS